MNSLDQGKTSVRRGRDRGFLSGARELDVARLQVDGELPSWLRGNLLLNGPALWDLPRQSLKHWFDGYAMLHRLHIDDAGVSYRSRFAASEAYLRSMAAGAPAFGEFGTENPASLWSRLRAVEATDNPAVVLSRLGVRWAAVTETPHLTFFNPETLATEERLDLDQPGQAMHLMAAHGFTLRDGGYLNVGCHLGPSCEMLVFWLTPRSKKPEILGRIKTPKAGYLHAFALAPGHAIVWECALRVQPLGLRFGTRSYKDNFRWEPKGGSMLHALPLTGGPSRSWRIPPMFAFHAVQAWADGDRLLLDLIIYDDARVIDELALAPRRSGAPMRSTPRLVRYRLSPDRSEAEPEALGVPLELPQVHPARVGAARARVCWGAGIEGEFNDRTLRVDLDSGAVTSWQRANAVHLEPLFVPRPGGSGDDDGVLLVPTLSDDDEATQIGVIDARSMQQLAAIQAPQVVPFGFHAAFA